MHNERLKRHDFGYALAALVIIGLGIGAYFYVDHTTNTREYESLTMRAESFAALLNVTRIASLTGTEADLENPDYLYLKQQLSGLKEYNPDLQFIYLMGQADARVFFLVDAEDEDSEDYSPPGQTYSEASDELFTLWDPDAPPLLEIYADRWGDWISALAPIRNAEGETIAVLGIDKDAAQHRMYFLIEAALIVISTLSLLLLVGILYASHRKELDIVDMKSDFVAAASHELRAPLTSIRWTLSTLRDDTSLSQTARASVNEIYERVRGLVDLTNTFLLTSSTDHGVMRPDDMKVVNLSPTLSLAIQHSMMIARMKNIKINVQFSFSDPIIVRADAEHLRLVFENLLSNAIKYSSRDSTITFSYEDRGKLRAFMVHDTGIGVPKKDQQTIFTGFRRASNAKHSGILRPGFGLYMVKKIVDYHGGTVTCDSEPTKGTTFTVVIPSGV